jgi:DNA-binding FadR family transcriptional regulator
LKRTATPAPLGDDARLAAIVAARLTEEIVGDKLPVGTLIGTEAELMERFGVSRDPLREAIRILEWQGLVAASRGRSGGGLRVLSAGDVALSNLLRTYLQLSDISLGEVLEAIGILQDYLLASVAQRATRAQIARMKQVVAEARPKFEQGSTDLRLNADIGAEIASASPNVVARVLANALAETCIDFAHAGRLPKPEAGSNLNTIEAFEATIAAIEKRDAGAALKIHHALLRTSAEALSALERRNSRIWNTHSFLMGDYTEALLHMSGRQKLAAAIGYKIAAYIRRNEFAPGTPVSLHDAGIDEDGGSRAVQREAIRLLEFFGVLDVRRGNEGGLYTTRPDPAHVLMFARLYFSGMQIDAKHLALLREHLGQTAVDLCASKLSTAGLLEIRARAEQFDDRLDARAASAIAREIGRLIFVYSGNRALLLFGEVLFVLSQDEPGGSMARAWRPAQVGKRCAEAVAQLTTAFLKSNQRDMTEALNALRRTISVLA